MRIEGLLELSTIGNLVIPSGDLFPEASEGELFRLTHSLNSFQPGIYTFRNGGWEAWGNLGTGSELPINPVQPYLFYKSGQESGLYLYANDSWTLLSSDIMDGGTF